MAKRRTHEPGADLAAWAAEALELGFESFKDGDRVPFVMLIAVTGERRLVNLESSSGVIDSELVEGGRELIREFADGALYALVWDGVLTDEDGQRHDAVIAEVGGRDGGACLFARKYRTSRTGKLSRVGTPFLAASAEHLWSRPSRKRVSRSTGRKPRKTDKGNPK